MTPEEYVRSVQKLGRQRDYALMLALAERVGPGVEDQLDAEQVRILRVQLKHADMVLSNVRSEVSST
jgi:hypothetical protein